MAKDFIIFLHGVNTRDWKEYPTYADPLIELLRTEQQKTHLDLEMIPLYWGDVFDDLERELLQQWEQSPSWYKLGFQNIREKQLLQFTGDGALYISRRAGIRVVEKLRTQLLAAFGAGPYDQDDCFHLVTHSMGTVILFDILFSRRWEPTYAGGYRGVEEIRKLVYGLEPNPKKGVRLSSIHTMGSPISLFTLMLSTGKAALPPHDIPEQEHIPATHDILPGLARLLDHLPQGYLPWYNYIHPEDPVASPLETVLPSIVENNHQSRPSEQTALRVHDIPLPSRVSPILKAIADLRYRGTGRINRIYTSCSDLLQTGETVFLGRSAHGSYWHNPLVAHKVIDTIQHVHEQPPKASSQVALT